jgi:LPXTG-motif cell wall-anchored protein
MLELYGIENLDELSELEKIKLFKKLGKAVKKAVKKIGDKFAPEETPEQVPPEQAPSQPSQIVEETTSKPIYLIAGIGLIGVLFLIMMKKKKSIAEIDDYSCGCGI